MQAIKLNTFLFDEQTTLLLFIGFIIRLDLMFIRILEVKLQL